MLTYLLVEIGQCIYRSANSCQHSFRIKLALYYKKLMQTEGLPVTFLAIDSYNILGMEILHLAFS